MGVGQEKPYLSGCCEPYDMYPDTYGTATRCEVGEKNGEVTSTPSCSGCRPKWPEKQRITRKYRRRDAVTEAVEETEECGHARERR